MTPDNDWYGHKAVLAAYCGVRSPGPMYCYVPHGWEADYPGDGRRRFTTAPLLLWNDLHVRQATSRGARNVHCLGAPFSYLVRQRFPAGPPPPGRGTLCFPAHSAEGEITFDVRRTIDSVQEALPGPYTVSVFYQDLDGPAVAAYHDAGWRVVSFGRRSTATFITDLADEVVRHEAVTSNVVQTAVWYGALLGRRVVVLPSGASPVEPQQEEDYARGRWPDLFDPTSAVERLTAQAQEELGFHRTLDPDGLRSLVGWDSVAKRAVARAVRTAVDLRDYRSSVSR